MNTRFIVLILLKYLCWNGYVQQLIAIPKVKFDMGSSNGNAPAHASHDFLSKEQQRYLYLNYKEAYGLRFDPTKSDKIPHLSNELNGVSAEENVDVTADVTRNEYDGDEGGEGIPIVSNALANITIKTTTIASPSSTEPSTIIDDKVSLTEEIPPKKRHMLAFSALRYQIDTSVLQNTTDAATTIMSSSTALNTTEEPSSSSSSLPPMSTTTTLPQEPLKPSTLRDTLNLIRKKLKQWLTFGGDKKPPLISGQRFLSVFNVIQFENSPCTPTQEDMADMSGICYHDYECEQMGGTSVSECADGLGVCCVFTSACGQSTDRTEAYFQNPGWPDASMDRLICTLTVNLQEDVAQVRLDFISFELKPPIDGNCVDDQFSIAGQNLNNQVPTLCGINNGQHMYIEVDNSLDRKLFLSILTTTAGVRAFNMRVTQLKDSLAPNNCLQYYTDTDGWFQTFNYDDTSQFVVNRIPSYFNNLNYVVCIRRQWNYCSTAYTNEADGAEYDFQLLNLDSEGTSVIPEKQAGVEIFSCNDDYIAVNSIRLCGEKLNDASRTDDLTVNAMITDTTNGLNIIPVRTNAAAVGRGFRINYMQIPCDEQPVTMEPAPIETTEQPAPEEDTPTDSKYKRKRTVKN